jgi:hypothetical protein
VRQIQRLPARGVAFGFNCVPSPAPSAASHHLFLAVIALAGGDKPSRLWENALRPFSVPLAMALAMAIAGAASLIAVALIVAGASG